LVVVDKSDFKSSIDINKDLAINSDHPLNLNEVTALKKSTSWIQPKLDVLRGILKGEILQNYQEIKYMNLLMNMMA
jgi:hypothetical protein